MIRGAGSLLEEYAREECDSNKEHKLKRKDELLSETNELKESAIGRVTEMV